MSINAVKGVEIGAGFGAAELSGEENADEMRMGNQGASFLSNHAGYSGGISTAAYRRTLRREAHVLDPVAAPHHRPQRRRYRYHDKGRHDPASASARCRSARP